MKINEILIEGETLTEWNPIDAAKNAYSKGIYGAAPGDNADMSADDRLQHRKTNYVNTAQLKQGAAQLGQKWQQYSFNLPDTTKKDGATYVDELVKWTENTVKNKAANISAIPKPQLTPGPPPPAPPTPPGPPSPPEIQKYFSAVLQADAKTRNAPAAPEEDVKLGGGPVLQELQQLARTAINSGSVTKEQMNNLLQHLRTVSATLSRT